MQNFDTSDAPDRARDGAGVAQVRRQALPVTEAADAPVGLAQAWTDAVAAAQQQLQSLQTALAEQRARNDALEQAQVGLQARAERYADLYAAAPVGYFILRRDGTIVEVNPAGARLMDRERLQLQGQRFAAFVTPAERHRFQVFLHHLFATRRALVCEVELARRVLPPLGVRIEASLTPDGGECRAVVIDMSDHQQAERALIQSEARFHALADLASDWYWEQDREFRTVRLEGAFESATGLSIQSQLGRTRWAHPALNLGQADWDRHRAQLQAREVFRNFEIQRTDAQGQMRWVSVSGAPVYDEAGEFCGYRGVGQNISERKRQEQRRVSLAQRVEELSRGLVQAQEQARRRFSYELHERTSANLAALRINLDMIAAEPALSRGGPVFADRVADTRALIEDTTQSIRDICCELHPPVLDPGGLLGVTHSYVQTFSRRTGLQVQIDCAHGEVRLAADLELALFRVVQESLTNCAKHAQACEVVIRMQLDARPIRLSVSDDGVGFDVGRVVRGRHATGLGLLNMQETVEYAGGLWRIISVPGAGTTIHVEI